MTRLSDPYGLGELLYGLGPADVSPHAPGWLLAAGGTFMTLIPDQHDGCAISSFCRNPLHPGPCKGWKKGLGVSAPGALKAINAAHAEKVAAKRVKVAEAKSAAAKQLTEVHHASPLHAKKAVIKKASLILGDNEHKAAKKADRVVLNKTEIKKYSKIKAAQITAMRGEVFDSSPESQKKYAAFVEGKIADALAADNEGGSDANYRAAVGNIANALATGWANKHCAEHDGDCDGLLNEGDKAMLHALLTGDTGPLLQLEKDFKADKPLTPVPDPQAGTPREVPPAPAAPKKTPGKEGTKPTNAAMGAASDETLVNMVKMHGSTGKGAPAASELERRGLDHDGNPLPEKASAATPPDAPKLEDFEPPAEVKKLLAAIEDPGSTDQQIADAAKGIDLDLIKQHLSSQQQKDLASSMVHASKVAAPPKPTDVALINPDHDSSNGFLGDGEHLSKEKFDGLPEDHKAKVIDRMQGIAALWDPNPQTPSQEVWNDKAARAKAVLAKWGVPEKAPKVGKPDLHEMFGPDGDPDHAQAVKAVIGMDQADWDSLSPAEKSNVAMHVADAKGFGAPGANEAQKHIASLLMGKHADAPPKPSAPAPAVSPHAKKASDYAHGVVSGTASKKVDTYDGLTGDDFGKLPPDTQKLILADLTAAKAKFIAPSKKANTQAIMDYLSPYAGGGAGAGGALGHPNPAASSEAKAKAGAAFLSEVEHLGGASSFDEAKAADTLKVAHDEGQEGFFNSFAATYAQAAVDKLELMHSAAMPDGLDPIAGGVLTDALKKEMLDKIKGGDAPTPTYNAWKKAIKSGDIEDAYKVADTLPDTGSDASLASPDPSSFSEKSKLAVEALLDPELSLAPKGATNLASKVDKEHFDSLSAADKATIAAHLDKGMKSKSADVAAKAAATKASLGLLGPAPSAGPVTPASSTAKSAAAPIGTGSGLDGIPEAKQAQILADLKAQPFGTFLSDPKPTTYGNLLALAAAHGTQDQPMSVMQVLQSVDAQMAKKLGVTNINKWEKEFVSWLQTPDGKAFADANPTPDATLVKGLKGVYEGPTTNLTELAKKVKLLPGPGPFDDSVSSGKFAEISTVKAASLRKKMLDSSGGKYSPEELSGIGIYTGSSYHEMNSYLRGKKADTSDYYKNAIKNTQAAMRPLPQDVLLRRGTGWDQLPVGFRSPEGAKKLIGHTVMDEAFLSTSVGGQAAFSGKPLHLEIEAPKGTHAAYVEGKQDGVPISVNQGEREMLLAAGQHYKILSVTEKGGHTVVRMRIVTPDEA